MATEKISLKEKMVTDLATRLRRCSGKFSECIPCFFIPMSLVLRAAAAGTMFLVARLWDSFFDVFVGIISDRTKSRYGKYRPYLLWFALHLP